MRIVGPNRDHAANRERPCGRRELHFVPVLEPERPQQCRNPENTRDGQYRERFKHPAGAPRSKHRMPPRSGKQKTLSVEAMLWGASAVKRSSETPRTCLSIHDRKYFLLSRILPNLSTYRTSV